MRDGRINGYVAEWCEIASATRYRLDRVDENVCDGYTTPETDVLLLDSDVPVEVKGCKIRIADGHGRTMKGRFTIGPSHDELVERDGQYALVVYDTVGDHTGHGCLVVVRIALVPARVLDEHLSGDRRYEKVSWGDVFNSLEQPDSRGPLDGETRAAIEAEV